MCVCKHKALCVCKTKTLSVCMHKTSCCCKGKTFCCFKKMTWYSWKNNMLNLRMKKTCFFDGKKHRLCCCNKKTFQCCKTVCVCKSKTRFWDPLLSKHVHWISELQCLISGKLLKHFQGLANSYRACPWERPWARTNVRYAIVYVLWVYVCICNYILYISPACLFSTCPHVVFVDFPSGTCVSSAFAYICGFSISPPLWQSGGAPVRVVGGRPYWGWRRGYIKK